ncbi:MAG: carboxynorspermidine decarboxylase [Bacteroidaceae bacterium]|nr:carboxynorspermidine decarboxylase [Bacteroidaceae bacterium]
MRESAVQTPCYVIDADAIERNLRVLRGVMDRTGCRILLAQKAFSGYALYPLISKYLTGAVASGIFEARLCHEEMPGAENHIYNPAFRAQDIPQILEICDHIVFNSIAQLEKFGPAAKQAGLQVGLRINPEISTQKDHAIYDPCAPGSRLGVTLSQFEEASARALPLLDGLHFHTLCEQDSDALEVTLDEFCRKFGKYLANMKWVNFGGGHHITRHDYDIARLERCIGRMRSEYGLLVYLEPGEAVALNGGYLYTSVLEIQSPVDGVRNAILDTSAACHMPDVLEMPYRPPLGNSAEAHEKPFTYRFGGPTCLAGDTIGEYSFDHELHEGQILVFEDMSIYSMVKNNTFNGVPLPSIYIKRGDDLQLWKSFSYADFKSRL